MTVGKPLDPLPPFGVGSVEKATNKPTDDLINLAIELYKINVSQGIPPTLAKQQIMSSMPFNLFPLINEYLK